MGKATILQNIGAGLYQIRLDYDLAPLDAELERLNAERGRYAETILAALATWRRTRVARDDARLGMDAVIEQWQAAVISATEDPPPLEQEDPEVEVEDEQAEALLEAINALRSGSLTRVAELDAAVLSALRVMATTGRTEEYNSSPEQRATSQGYGFDPAVGVASVHQFGALSAADAVERMTRAPRNESTLTSEDYTDCGVAYLYAPRNPYGHLWGVYLSAPGLTIEIEYPEDDPARDASETTADELERIELPTIDTFQPERLAEACAIYGRGGAEYRAADTVVERLQVEQEERIRRIGRLEALRESTIVPIHAWCCRYQDEFDVGLSVYVAEVPGWRDRAAVDRIAIINDFPFSYSELGVNIVPISAVGQLRPAETLPDGVVFINAAIEPGHLRWKPLWRYGEVTALPGEHGPLYRVQLPSLSARAIDGDQLQLDSDADRQIDCPSELSCSAEIRVGDEVLIYYLGQDRAQPRIIGWRREPKDCGGRLSWSELR